MDSLSIPSLDINQNVDRLEMVPDQSSNSPNLRISPQPASVSMGEGFGDQSNSEDSSLSDSDRTLVGDAPGEFFLFKYSHYNITEEKSIEKRNEWFIIDKFC